MWLSCFTDQGLPASDDVQCPLCEAAGVSEAFGTVASPPPSLEESLHHRPILLVPVYQKEDPSVKKKRCKTKTLVHGTSWIVLFLKDYFSNGKSGMPEQHNFTAGCCFSVFFPICLALIENKLNYENNDICIFVQGTVISYPCVCFSCTHLKDD